MVWAHLWCAKTSSDADVISKPGTQTQFWTSRFIHDDARQIIDRLSNLLEMSPSCFADSFGLVLLVGLAWSAACGDCRAESLGRASVGRVGRFRAFQEI